MTQHRLKTRLKRTAVGRRVAAGRARRRAWLSDRQTVRKWLAAGRPAPPPAPVKQRIVREYAKRYGLRVFVETGTFRGDMVEVMRRRVARVVSIELDPALQHQASEHFAGETTITIVCGDSAEELPRILATLDEPALFWLDGHYSGGDTARGAVDSPIRLELDHVLGHPTAGHVVLVDDARLFDGTHDYPTLAEVAEIVRARRPEASTEVADDIIRIV